MYRLIYLGYVDAQFQPAFDARPQEDRDKGGERSLSTGSDDLLKGVFLETVIGLAALPLLRILNGVSHATVVGLPARLPLEDILNGGGRSLSDSILTRCTST